MAAPIIRQFILKKEKTLRSMLQDTEGCETMGKNLMCRVELVITLLPCRPETKINRIYYGVEASASLA